MQRFLSGNATLYIYFSANWQKVLPKYFQIMRKSEKMFTFRVLVNYT
jgi:hypothetical protein